MQEKLAILLVEDNIDIASQLVDFLSDKGAVIDYASTGKEALALVQTHSFDLIILDLMLPDADGLQLCEQLKTKANKHLPVLMLTARDSLDDKLKGFAMGADDYLTKPFSLEEVYMRCIALSRRAMLHRDKTVTVGDLTLDLGQRKVEREGKSIALSSTDFAILKELMLAYPNAVSKRDLTQKVWGDDMPETDALRSHIYVIRNVLDKPFSHAMIKTVHGIGFKLSGPS